MPQINMPIRAAPFAHQIQAYDFVCGLFGLTEGGDADHSINHGDCAAALLMEM